MEENKPQETFDPRDLNQDGKVTFGEKVQYAAGQAVEKAKDVYADAKEKTVEVAGKVADKTKEVAGKVADKSKELYADAKEKAADLKEKAADKIDTAKQKLQEKKKGLSHEKAWFCGRGSIVLRPDSVRVRPFQGCRQDRQAIRNQKNIHSRHDCEDYRFRAWPVLRHDHQEGIGRVLGLR